MEICYDGIGLSHLTDTKYYTYTYELINHLLNIYPQAKYHIVTNSEKKINLWEKKNNIKFFYTDLDRKNNDYSMLVDYIKEKDIPIYHSINNGFSIPEEKVCKNVISVHDLLAISMKEYVDIKYFNKFIKVFPDALEKADKIIAVSNFIKDELIKHYKISNDKIKVIYPVCSKRFKLLDKNECKSFIKKKYNIIGDYLLCVGSIHRRKKLHYILRTFKKALKYCIDLKLVIIGNYGGKRENHYLKLKEYAKTLNIEDNIIFMGKVDYNDMVYFYNDAKCIINLSAYEGFPLSLVEAMACYTPVICDKSSFFEEVLGQGAVFTDDNNIDETKDIILDILYNKDFRRGMIKKGVRQIEKYQSDESIKEMIRVYESIL